MAEASSTPYHPDKPLGLIAGIGALPHHIIALCQSRNQPVYLIAIEGQTPDELKESVPTLSCRIGAVETALNWLAEHQVEQLVMAGTIKRPKLTSILPDAKGRQLLKRLGGALVAGDDTLLSKIIGFFEAHGIAIVGAHDICQEFLADSGVMTRVKPSKQQQKDTSRGLSFIRHISDYDMGQAVIVSNDHIIGVEAMEGTAELIRRCADYDEAKGGVLVKAPKQGQELRADMPAVGEETVRLLSQHGFSGMSLLSGATLMIGKPDVILKANSAGLFIQGVHFDAAA